MGKVNVMNPVERLVSGDAGNFVGWLKCRYLGKHELVTDEISSQLTMLGSMSKMPLHCYHCGTEARGDWVFGSGLKNVEYKDH
ncbi:MAG: hypothetical protein QXL01_06640 [Thermoplasmatales archaeon]